uniref:Adenosylhomocysteinase n=1 Tax=Siphoviridae sp. ctvok7 TaxID=2827596 RepID=A0A8S5LLV0_9CAUD|nr:MAG TPA: Adenosylhomocysteinase [Siphoviridae sp. ctvok7]
MRGWLGYSEANGRYKAIIDLYNTQRPLPRGYAVQYDDEWCATTVTAAGIKAGLQDIIYGECSCSRMIELYQRAGRWMEDDAYRPDIGDIIMYHWDDTGRGDDTGSPNHVGVVSYINGNTITVIEGNKGQAVSTRTISVNGRYIRGYCLPDFASMADKGDDHMKIYHWFADMPDWSRESAEKAYRKGVIKADADSGAVNVYEVNLQTIVWLDRLGLLD